MEPPTDAKFKRESQGPSDKQGVERKNIQMTGEKQSHMGSKAATGHCSSACLLWSTVEDCHIYSCLADPSSSLWVPPHAEMAFSGGVSKFLFPGLSRGTLTVC